MIREGDTVVIHGKKALVKELVPVAETAFPKAIIEWEGEDYTVGLSGLKLYEDTSNDNPD